MKRTAVTAKIFATVLRRNKRAMKTSIRAVAVMSRSLSSPKTKTDLFVQTLL